MSNSLTIMPVKDTNYSIHGRKCIINELQSKMFVDFQTDWNSKLLSNRKVQVGKDQEKAQSEKDSHSKNQGGKKPN